MKQINFVRSALIFWHVPEMRWNIAAAYLLLFLQVPVVLLFMAVSGILLIPYTILLAVARVLHEIQKLVLRVLSWIVEPLERAIQRQVDRAHEKVSVEEALQRSNLPRRRVK
jgi:hypothetical protein